MKKLLLLSLLLPSLGFAQVPAGYYDGTSNLGGYALKTKLHEIISSNNINWHYGDLGTFYSKTDLDQYYDHDAGNTTVLLDLYSEIPNGPDAYEYTVENMIGSANAEGHGWNREHIMPQSTFNSNYPMQSDLFYVIPTDARINQLRSNYPYGKAGNTNYYTFTNGSKISNNATHGSGYTGRVYEPIDEFKGDIARSLLYFAVRYEGKLGLFNYYNGTSPANDRNPLDGTEEKAFEDWYIAMLLQWHHMDPVSQREIDRNNEVYEIQKNRNPFIDNPQWVNMIWNQTPSSAEPQAPTNLGVTQTSAYFVNLSWAPSPDADVLGYKVYKNDLLFATTKDTSISIDHLEPSTLYHFKVQAYNNGYSLSPYSNTVSATTLTNDVYAKDLMITKYLNGSENNKALEITNKTGHPVNLNKYRLSIQFYNSVAGNYYFPAAYELEGIVQPNETFVVLNPYSNFSCITNDEARFVTGAPQLTFSGSQYIELRYASKTIDAIGTKDVNNSASLSNISLYRSPSVHQPTSTFNLSEWQSYPADYCENIGSLATASVHTNTELPYSLYPNPVAGNLLYIKGNHLKQVQQVSVFDLSGKLIQQESLPFKDKNWINVEHLKSGVYLLKIDHHSLKFIKK